MLNQNLLLEKAKSFDLLECLLETVLVAEEAKDCLDVLEHYEWVCHSNSDEGRFNDLLSKGTEEILSPDELHEFLDLIDLMVVIYTSIIIFIRPRNWSKM